MGRGSEKKSLGHLGGTSLQKHPMVGGTGALSRLCFKLRGEQGSGPKGVGDLCFHTYKELSPPPGIGPLGWDLGLLAGIWTSRLIFGLKGLDLGFQTRILAFTQGFGPRG